MGKKQRCDVAASVVFLIICALLGMFSFGAVSAIHDNWRALDYWLAWFSAASLVGAVMCAFTFGVALYSALDCDTE